MGKFRVEVRELVRSGTDPLTWRYRVIGEIDEYLDLDLILRFNDIGTWKLRMIAGSEHAALLNTKDRGVVIWYEGLNQPVISGPVRGITRSWDAESDSGPGSIEFSGPDDLTYMAERIGRPSSSKEWSQQATDTYEPTKQNAAAVVRALALGHLGASQPFLDRRVPAFDVAATVPDYPLTAAGKFTMETCLKISQDITKPYGTGFRTRYVPATGRLLFEVYKPRDLTKQVRFSPDAGNLGSFSYSLTAPKSNDVVLAGMGEGPTRYFEERKDLSSYGDWGFWSELFLDRKDLEVKKDPDQGNKPVFAPGQEAKVKEQITAAFNETFAENSQQASVSFTPVETEDLRYGRDYQLGDKVTIVMDGVEYYDLVREVHLSDSAEAGPELVPTIGSENASETPTLYREVKKLWKAVGYLNRNTYRDFRATTYEKEAA